MPITKFHEKNIAVFGKIETTTGTYNAPAASDCLAATAITGSTTYETGSYTYLGDDQSRDEVTYQKDNYADVSIETPQQVLGVLNPALTVAQAPLSQWLQACGAFVTVNGSTGVVTYSNDQVSNSSLSIDYRKTSSEDLVNQKLFKFLACRGQVDVSANVGELPTLKFSFKGNSNNPEANPKLIPDYGNQVANVAPVIRQATIVNAQIAPFGEPFTAAAPLPGTVTSITRVGAQATVTMSVAHNLTTGRKVTVAGATDTLYNGVFEIAVLSATTFSYTMTGIPAASPASGTITITSGGFAQTFCFSTLQSPNFFGFDYERYLTGCEEGFAKGAVPTDVTVGMLEDQVGGISFDPDANITKLFTTQLKFGTGNGRFVTYRWSKLLLADVKESKVAKYFGREVKFRNTGISYIILE